MSHSNTTPWATARHDRLNHLERVESGWPALHKYSVPPLGYYVRILFSTGRQPAGIVSFSLAAAWLPNV